MLASMLWTEALALPPGRQLDEVMHEILGFSAGLGSHSYSTDLTEAWTLMRGLQFHSYSHGDKINMRVTEDARGLIHCDWASGETMALAVCRARIRYEWMTESINRHQAYLDGLSDVPLEKRI
jgi:hypothetical protein